MDPGDRVPLSSKLALGSGALLDNIGQNSVKQLALPIFSVGLGLNPALVGMALTVFRLWDAFSDPCMGAISDATRSRHGRRRPWMLLGAFLTGAVYPFLWFVSPEWSPNAILGYFIVIGIIYFTAYTIFSVPYHALAFEMTPDYDEKTRLMTYRTIFNGLGGIITGWLYALSQAKIFSDPLDGAKWMGVAVGIFLMVAGAIPAFVIRERYLKQALHQKTTGFWKGITLTLKNRPFAILTTLAMLILIGGNSINALGFYLNVYYVHHGDTAAASIIQGAAGTAFGIGTLVVLPVIALIAAHIGKSATMGISLIFNIIGSISAWFLITPASPWLQLIPFLLGVPGVMGFWLMFSSMSADLCDYDEWKTGMRREGMFSAVYAWISKVAVSLSYGLSGLVIVLSGFRQEHGAVQTEAALTWMRTIYSFAPVGLYLIAGILLMWYPLSRKRMGEIRTDLELRRGRV
jgi:GPH family glycoside/pentoside/hexuronide:cation symporter